MGISNAIGSNVFDMLCLGLPWLLKTSVFEIGSVIEINSDSLIMSTSLLIGTMIYTDVCFYLNNWIIDKRIAVLFLVTYFAVIGFTTLMELLACPCNLHF
uniref:Putative sodium/potassium/calcium exchanger CG1090 (Trinotate prediction) n=1 Tax=Myxobolus squamalis TaxID=59785 RepID=A0A6B2GFC2_MYXSQ